jgi:ABC-type ATPase with predicted acetyltransferase domain
VPSFDIIKETILQETFRISNILNTFDIQEKKIVEHFTGDIDIENKNWNIGLIVGGSGTGKTTIAKELFGKHFLELKYIKNSVIDDMPKNKNIKEITQTFTSVGFASPPSWLKPYSVLSNGEKMRVDLANNILQEKEIFVFDEFTSVVNREVAKTGSYAISKAIKKMNKKFIAISCHKDIIEWLEPDWIYNTDEKMFFFAKDSIKDQKSSWKYMKQYLETNKKYGKILASITI